ncbi:MAG: AbrB/MazE/SpoVT family DNA-binding domain-containing protein [Candidatus Helarchaeota archaeon]
MTEVKIRIGKRFSVIIPKEIREKLGLKEGDLITIKKSENKIIITPEKISPFKKLANLVGDIRYNDETKKEAEKYLFTLIGDRENGDH